PGISSRPLKTTSNCVLVSKASSKGTRPPHRLGGAHRRGAPYSSHRAPREGTPPVLSSPAALLEDRIERSIVKPYEVNAKSFATHLLQSSHADRGAFAD